jgi:hypothetical protein
MPANGHVERVTIGVTVRTTMWPWGDYLEKVLAGFSKLL